MQQDTTPPINLSENTRVRMPLLMMLTVVGSVAAGAMVINSGREKLADLDRRMMRVEESIGIVRDVQKDVEWLRKLFEAKPRE